MGSFFKKKIVTCKWLDPDPLLSHDGAARPGPLILVKYSSQQHKLIDGWFRSKSRTKGMRERQERICFRKWLVGSIFFKT